jgi:predicted nucleic acid-binding protein
MLLRPAQRLGVKLRGPEGAQRPRALYELLRDHLRAFSDLNLESADYEEAAEAFNRCRERGIQGSNTGFLICSAALRRELAVYTTDKDFLHYEKVLELKLHEPRE